MSLSLDLAAELQSLLGQTFVPARVVTVDDGGGIRLALDVLQVEHVGCAIEELRLSTPLVGGSAQDVLQRWAAGLCGRVTYLLETLGALEFDAESQQALIRSTTPDASAAGRKYYEVILAARGGGQFTLRRYEAIRGQVGRQPVPMRLTHEQLSKLVNDLVATCPARP